MVVSGGKTRSAAGAVRAGGVAAAWLMTGALHAAQLELRVEGLTGPLDPGDAVTIGVWMTSVPTPAAGFQAFLEYDAVELTFVSGGYTPTPFGLPIITPIVPVAGTIDLAAGIDIAHGQPPSAADARLATLTFIVNMPICEPAVDFRPADPPSRLSTPLGAPILPLALVAFPPPPCISDLDGDASVGFSDLLVLLSSWGTPCPGDIDDDGAVDFDDLLILLSDWGPC